MDRELLNPTGSMGEKIGDQVHYVRRGKDIPAPHRGKGAFDRTPHRVLAARVANVRNVEGEFVSDLEVLDTDGARTFVMGVRFSDHYAPECWSYPKTPKEEKQTLNIPTQEEIEAAQKLLARMHMRTS